MKILQHIEDKSHIIWDWNGTLVNDVDHAIATVNGLLVENNLQTLTTERYKQIFNFPVINYYRDLGFDFSVESFEVLADKFVGKYMEGFRSCPLVDGMGDVLSSLKQKGKTQSILSASDQESLDEMIKHYDLESVFKYVFGINNKLAASKLERGHELILCSEIPKDQTVLIGDTIHDLEVGKELGIDVVLVAHGHQSAERLKAVHPCVISAN